MSINGKIEVSYSGNLTADPEIRFTNKGIAVATFGVAVTPRVLDHESGQWKDGPTSFMRTNVWREQAEHVAESLKKGQRVTVTGILHQRDWEDDNKQKRTSWEVQADEVSASLRYATAQITKAAKSGGPAEARPAQDEQPPF